MRERERPNPEVTPEFLIKVFSSPEFAQRARNILDLTSESLIHSRRKHNRFEIPELGFLIDKKWGSNDFYIWQVNIGGVGTMSNQNTEIGLSEILKLAFRHPWVLKDDRRLFALVHFHEPWETPLIPSAYRKESQTGDLYGLFVQRKSGLSQPFSYLNRKTVFVIGKVASPDLPEYPAEFLFIQEGWIENEPDDELLENLEFLQRFLLDFGQNQSQEEIVRILRRYGYNAGYFAVPKERWMQRNLFSKEQLQQMADFSY